MPDVGTPPFVSPPTASHTSTLQWQSFEVRMRRRRAERCLIRAQVALEAGFLDEAREALDEARRLDPASPDIDNLERQLVAAGTETPPVPRRHIGRQVAAVACGLLAIAGALAVNSWLDLGASSNVPRPWRPDVVLPAESAVTPIVSSIVVPETAQHEEQTERVAEPEPREAVLPRVTEASPSPVATSGSAPPARVSALPPPPAAIEAIDTNLAPVSMPPAAAERPETPPPAAPVVDDRARVRAVLSRYEAAYSGLDAAAARQVWPGVDERALARAFDGLSSQRLSLGRCDLSISGASARAECSGTASWSPKVGGGDRTANRRWQFELAKSGDDWHIVRATAR